MRQDTPLPHFRFRLGRSSAYPGHAMARVTLESRF